MYAYFALFCRVHAVLNIQLTDMDQKTIVSIVVNAVKSVFFLYVHILIRMLNTFMLNEIFDRLLLMK